MNSPPPQKKLNWALWLAVWTQALKQEPVKESELVCSGRGFTSLGVWDEWTASWQFRRCCCWCFAARRWPSEWLLSGSLGRWSFCWQVSPPCCYCSVGWCLCWQGTALQPSSSSRTKSLFHSMLATCPAASHFFSSFSGSLEAKEKTSTTSWSGHTGNPAAALASENKSTSLSRNRKRTAI